MKPLALSTALLLLAPSALADDTGSDDAEAEASAPADEEPTPQGDPPTRAKTANAAAGSATGGSSSLLDWFELHGYARPGFGYQHRPDALPADVHDYGFFGAAGLMLSAQPFKMFQAQLNTELSTAAISAVTDVNFFDSNGDGSADDVRTIQNAVPGITIQEATLRFIPSDWFRIRGGVMRIPFTLSQQAYNNETLFPTRATSNERFIRGMDVGAQAEGNFGDGIFTTSIGAFNGDSLQLTVPGAEARGVVIAYRGDLNPFGKFDRTTSDPKRGPFRLGVGFGAIVRPTTLFDATTRTEPRNQIDFRFSGSLRMSVRGLYFQAEYFRTQQTDDFSSRPEVADGAYGQLAFFFTTVESFAIEPVARVSFTNEDQTFDPRLTGFTDAGLNLYPVADGKEPDAVKLSLLYHGERRFTESEDAHSMEAAILLQF